MKTQQFHIKYALALIFLLPALILKAQNPSGYIPFHEYLLKNHTQFQRDAYGTRGIIYKEIAFMHDISVPLSGSSTYGWTYSDSGSFNYNEFDSLSVDEINGNDVAYAGVAYSWNNNTQFSNSYDANNNLLSTTGQVWDSGSSTWINSYMYAYTYNNGQITSEVYSTWNAGTSAFVYSFNYNYTYSGSTLTSLVYQNWTGSTWQNDTQYVYTFNQQNQLSQKITLLWDNGNGNWNNTLKEVYNYDAYGNNFNILGFAWNGSAWVNYSLTTKSYNQANALAGFLYTLWDSTASDYVNSYQEQYDYDYNYNNTSFENFTWSNNTWVPINYYFYTYDNNNNDNYEVDAYYANGGFTQTDQYYYYYDTFAVLAGINALPNPLNAEVFPNPGTGKVLFLSLNTEHTGQLRLNVYDALGRNILGQNRQCNAGENTLEIDLPALSAGEYYIQLRDIGSGKMSTLKFVRD